jgi:pimeloyl-ACP methyl ester carboxylesterase
MFYEVQGGGSPLLLLHGLPTSGRLWDLMLPALSRHFTCIIVDLPGFGRSTLLPDGRVDPDAYAGELEELRRTLSIPAWHIAGHDAGAVIAVHYAARFADHTDRLVLCSPPIFPDLKIPLLIRLTRLPVAGNLVASAMIHVFWQAGFRALLKGVEEPSGEIVEAFRKPFAGVGGIRQFRRVASWGDPRKVLAKTAGLLPQIRAQTLVLHGNEDGTIPVDFAFRAAELIPVAKAFLLDGGHFLPLVCADEVGTWIITFLESARD